MGQIEMLCRGAALFSSGAALPLALCVASALAGLLGWWRSSRRYGAELDGLRGRLYLAQQQLHAAERRLLELAGQPTDGLPMRVEHRRLDPDQIARIAAAARQATGSLQIAHSHAAADGQQYGLDLAQAFRSAGWHVSCTGPLLDPVSSSEGLKLFAKPTNVGHCVFDTLQEGGIDIELGGELDSSFGHDAFMIVTARKEPRTSYTKSH